MRARRPSIPASRTSTGTGCCTRSWASDSPASGRTRSDQEDGLPLEPAQAAGRPGYRPLPRAGLPPSHAAAAAAVDGHPRGPLRHPGLSAQRPHRDPGRQRTGTQNRWWRYAGLATGRAPDLDSAAGGPVTASSPTAPSTVARLAAQAARMEAATSAAISELTSALPSLDPQQAAAVLVVAVPIPVRGAARFLEELAGHLAVHRDALTSGSSLCPPVLLRLAEVLHDAGHSVVRPGCAHCGKVRS